MLVVKCDRCNGISTTQEEDILLGRERVILGTADEHGFYEDEIFDLCPECMDALKEWLIPVKETEDDK